MSIKDIAAWLQVITIGAAVLITGGLPISAAINHLTLASGRMLDEHSLDARLNRLEQGLRERIEREQEAVALLGREAARMQALIQAQRDNMARRRSEQRQAELRRQQAAMADSLRLGGETLGQIPGQRRRLGAEPQRVQDWLEAAEKQRSHAVLPQGGSGYNSPRLQGESQETTELGPISARSASAVWKGAG